MKKEIAQKILDQTKNNYDLIAKDWDLTRQYLSPGVMEFLSYIKNGDKILDAGCGNGRLVKLFNNVKVNYTGIDNSQELISLAKKNFPQNVFLEADILNLPFADNYFDVIFCGGVLHHFPGKQLRIKALEEMKRVLKSEGFIIVLNFHYTSPKMINRLFKFTLAKIFGKSELDFGDIYLDFNNRGVKRYIHLFTKNKMKQILKSIGFKVVKNYVSAQTNRGFKNLVTIAKKC